MGMTSWGQESSQVDTGSCLETLMCVHTYVYMESSICMDVYVSVHENMHIYTYLFTYMYVFLSIWMNV